MTKEPRHRWSEACQRTSLHRNAQSDQLSLMPLVAVRLCEGLPQLAPAEAAPLGLGQGARRLKVGTISSLVPTRDTYLQRMCRLQRTCCDEKIAVK